MSAIHNKDKSDEALGGSSDGAGGRAEGHAVGWRAARRARGAKR